MTAANRLVLASASPRRRQLLASIGLAFDVCPTDVDESVLPGESAVAYVERVAAMKARAVVSRTHGPELEDVAVLGADTTVDVDGAIIAKPVDDDDARSMLRLLSGRTHRVHTAVFGWTTDAEHTTVVTTDVTFATLGDGAIDWYLSMGEHLDKAGAYGMQGSAAAFIERIEGSPSNVIGLPLVETAELLRTCSVPVAAGANSR